MIKKHGFSTLLILFLVLILEAVPGLAKAQDSQSIWPLQKAPKNVVTCKIHNFSDVREMNLAQSVSGLMAKSVNEGASDEGVWVTCRNANYKIYYQSLIKRIAAKESGQFTVWELINRYKQRGIIKGYILYNAKRRDNSISLATIYASLKSGVLIDISQEATAISKGLPKLFDATKSTFDLSTFQSLSGQLNNDLLVVANPQFSNNKDYAIAHKCVIYYGMDSLCLKILNWIKPLSPIVGWNAGDEFIQIEACTSRGLINMPADWCENLALLSASSPQQPAKIKSIDPKLINWKEDQNYEAFVMSDGDNLQWTFGGFIYSQDYWNNLANTAVPMSFTSCPINLVQTAGDVYNQLVQTQPANVSVVEYGGGYFYPDLFGRKTADGEQLLRTYAKKINAQLKLTGVKVFGFICKDVSSAGALKAYQVYAEELEDITGIIAVQYSPYNGGLGKTFWVKNKKGIDIPIISAKYQLWANLKRKGSGNPKELAGFINQDNVPATGQSKQFNWTIVHAWSQYTNDSTNVPNNERVARKGTRGVTPVVWTKRLLNKDTKVVSIEELLWRLRMKHNSEDTRQVINHR
jgi:hypothetical protein